MKKIVLALFLVLFFAEWNIDFSIGVLDTALLILVTLVSVVYYLGSFFTAVFTKRSQKAVFSLMICASIILGTVIGRTVIAKQYETSKLYVEKLAREIDRSKNETGEYPEKLTELKNFYPSGNVPLGILRKRPLDYDLWENKEKFVLSFPFVAFMDAKYDGMSKEWALKD